MSGKMEATVQNHKNEKECNCTNDIDDDCDGLENGRDKRRKTFINNASQEQCIHISNIFPNKLSSQY